MTEGGFQDGLVIEMITLGAVETSVVGILVEAVAMGEMTLRDNLIRGNAGRNEETGHRVYQNGGKASRQASQSSKG